MEINYEGANRKSGYLPLVKDAPTTAYYDADSKLTLRLSGVGVHQKSGKYDVWVTLTPEDIGKIVTAFYKRALTKTK